MPNPDIPEEAVELPTGTYCICPDHDVLMPYRHVHWEWVEQEGCPVLIDKHERCGKPVQVFTNPAPALRKQGAEEERERLRATGVQHINPELLRSQGLPLYAKAIERFLEALDKEGQDGG
jgi:hypothetical protein